MPMASTARARSRRGKDRRGLPVRGYSSLVTRHSSLVTRHSSLVTCHSSLVTRPRRPGEGVAEDGLVGGVIVGGAVVAEGDADNAGPGMFHDPDRGMGLAGLRVPGGGEHFDGRAGRVQLRVVEFV